MINKRISIVITTINQPVVLESIAINCREFHRLEHVDVIVIGDRKTPDSARNYVDTISEVTGLNANYYDLGDQKEWLEQYPELDNIVPFNSDNRRNIGHLIAYENGADIIVALDDDNYPLEGVDYIAPFLAVGDPITSSLVSSHTGWINPCRELSSDCKMEFYPRGFPYSLRAHDEEPLTVSKDASAEARLLVKAGLWLGDPDVDAVTRLAFPVDVTGFSGNEVYFSPGTRCPFNTQNTAIHRSLMPAFYYVHMHKMIDGLCIDRYGDIWSSYFAQKVMCHFGGVLGFGFPLVNHVRNQHDLLQDLREEFPGMVLTNKLMPLLDRVSISGSSYLEATYSLAQGLRQEVSLDQALTNEEKLFLQEVADNIEIWLSVIERIDQQ